MKACGIYAICPIIFIGMMFLCVYWLQFHFQNGTADERIQKIEHICHGYCRDKVGPDSEAFIRKEYGSTHRYRTVLYCTVNGEMKEFVPPPSVRVNFTSY